MIVNMPKHKSIQGCVKGAIIPYVVVRRAGLSSKSFEQLVFSRTSDILDQVFALERSNREIASNLAEALHRAVGAAQSIACSAEILQLRRDIHNHRPSRRPLSHEAWDLLALILTPCEVEQVREYLDNHQRRQSLLIKGEQVFADEYASRRAVLKRALRKQEFRKALSLASPALSYELDQYLQSPDEALRRIRRTERSLIRYYSRAAFKLSPFSSFTRVGLAKLSKVQVPSAKRGSRVRSQVRLNRSLLASFAECITRHPELGGYVPVHVNTTSVYRGNKLMLLQRVYNGVAPTRLRTPQELVVNVSQSAAMEWIKTYLPAGSKVQMRQIREDLQKALPPGHADTCLRNLMDFGFLIHRIPPPDAGDSGIENLAGILDKVPSPLASSLKSKLERLEQLARCFGPACAQQRRTLLHEAADTTAEIFALLGTETSNWDGLIIFEDCGETRLNHISLPKQWNTAIDDLQEFLSQYASLLDRNLSVRMAIAQALKDNFAGGPVDLIEFMHRFTATPATAPEGQGLARYHHTPFSRGMEKIHVLALLRDQMGQSLSSSSEEEELDFRVMAEQHHWLERLQALAPEPHEAAVLGISCHCQPVRQADGSVNIVVNGFFDGALNTVLRACNHLEKSEQIQVIQELRQILQEAYPHSIPSELMTTFDFNVNLHPRGTEFVIDQEAGAAESIQLSDLNIRLEENGQIALFHRDWGTKITALHLGMMEVSFATFSQHFLSRLSSLCMIASKPFHPYHWNSGTQKSPVEAFPRLVYGRCVLRRRGWSLLPEALPHRERDDTDFTYLMRIQRWRRDLGLPEEAFVLADETPAQQGSRKAWNSRKPQYIHFGNFFLVDVFSKLVADGGKRLYIEEMLPSRAEWNQYSSRRTTEVILNLCIVQFEDSDP